MPRGHVRSLPEVHNELKQLEHELLAQLRAAASNDNDPGTVVDKNILSMYLQMSYLLTKTATEFEGIWNAHIPDRGLHEDER